jgi:hypothetical protein
MSVMLIATLLALQGPYYLSFTPGDVLKYSETFKVTEMVGTKKFSAEASRDQTIVVKKWERNRATLDIKFSEPVARGSGDSISLAASLKSIVKMAKSRWTNAASSSGRASRREIGPSSDLTSPATAIACPMIGKRNSCRQLEWTNPSSSSIRP